MFRELCGVYCEMGGLDFKTDLVQRWQTLCFVVARSSPGECQTTEVPPLGAPDLLCKGRADWERCQVSFSPAQGVVKYQGNLPGKICKQGPLTFLTVP